ncbi:hypothetical protein HanRHA438_Chr17g0840941 [Helianthus annuus]|nr:hypothetical protein HanRHA438_Chr17g0840941 [Helianthus annuus]
MKVEQRNNLAEPLSSITFHNVKKLLVFLVVIAKRVFHFLKIGECIIVCQLMRPHSARNLRSPGASFHKMR